jgi:hypothetical protein
MSVRTRTLILTIAAFVSFPSQAAAQAGTLGLSVGVPASVAALWQPTAAVGIRPEFTFDLFDAESTSTSRLGTSQFSSDTRQVGAGVSALFQVYREENLSVYVSPRYVYRRGHTDVTQEVPADVVVNGTDREIRGYSFTASLGGRYALGARFGVFGELGIDYSREDTTEPTFESRISRTGLRTSAGVLQFLF